MKELNTCNICGSDNLKTIYELPIPDTDVWNFIDRSSNRFIKCKMCRRCDWIFQSPTYSKEELIRLYNYTGSEPSEESLVEGAKNAIIRGKIILKNLSRHLNKPLNKLKILDVAGRNGELMHKFINAGATVDVLDVDTGKPIEGVRRKIRKDFENFKQSEKYDLITLLHILEHVENPLEFLSKAKNHLNEDGIVYIEVPYEIITPIILQKIGDHRHIGYFTKETINLALLKAGFEILSCEIKIGYVGSSLPVIRAIGRVSEKPLNYYKGISKKSMVARLLNYKLYLPRVNNKINEILNSL